jgi:hypothetical protein
MAADKPLTRFLIALSHSQALLAEFNSDHRNEVLAEWGLTEHELFSHEQWTLEQVRSAVAAEQEDGTDVEVAWWIWFFGGPRPRPDWVWGPHVDPDQEGDEESGGGGGGGGPYQAP